MRNFIRYWLCVLLLTSVFVLPVSAKQLEGTTDIPAYGTTSVTATVEMPSYDDDSNKVKTGDESQWQEYVLLLLMSGIVIVSNFVKLYQKE